MGDSRPGAGKSSSRFLWGALIAFLILLPIAWWIQQRLTTSSWDVFCAADSNRWDDALTLATSHKSWLNEKDNNGQTLLQIATASGRADVVERLAKIGADVNAPGSLRPNGGPTGPALMIALDPKVNSYHPTDAVVASLLKNGANPNATATGNFGKSTATVPMLYLAVSSGRLEAARMLLAAGANPNAVTPDGTIIQTAMATKNAAMVKLLQQSGATMPAGATAKGGKAPLAAPAGAAAPAAASAPAPAPKPTAPAAKTKRPAAKGSR